MRWFVYALHNKPTSKIYIGQTNNPERRLLEHNLKRGKHYTSKIIGEWKIIYKEEVNDRREALKREKQLKSFKGREFIKNLILD
ncbi:MAG: GIY-YIG nuclease family protein [Patescibacteria group bacterium]